VKAKQESSKIEAAPVACLHLVFSCLEATHAPLRQLIQFAVHRQLIYVGQVLYFDDSDRGLHKKLLDGGSHLRVVGLHHLFRIGVELLIEILVIALSISREGHVIRQVCIAHHKRDSFLLEVNQAFDSRSPVDDVGFVFLDVQYQDFVIRVVQNLQDVPARELVRAETHLCVAVVTILS